MKEHSFRKKQCVGNGIVDIDCSFASGAAEDGTFPAHITGPDGYAVAAVVDAYGTSLGSAVSTLPLKALHSGDGIYAVLRLGVGLYKIILDRVYMGAISFSAQLCLTTPANKLVTFKSPILETEVGSDSVQRSICRVQISDSSAEGIDLLFADRVSVRLTVKRSLA